MSDDLKETPGYASSLRQQARWIDEARENDRPATSQDITIDDIDTDELRDAAARIEQLEAQVDTLQTAMTAPTQDEIDLRSKLASSQAEALATAYLLGRGMAQSSIDDVREYHGETWQRALDEVAALATAPHATDGEKTPRVNRLVLGDDLDDGQRGKERD